MPLSEAQLNANRANAQKSTGPRTPEGKQKSSLNAFRHGITAQVMIMPKEEMEAYQKFSSEQYHAWNPQDVIDKQNVQTIIDCQWRLNNIRAQQMTLFALNHAETADQFDCDSPDVQTAFAAVNTFSAKAAELKLLTLYESRIDKVLQTAIKQFDARKIDRSHREEIEMHQAAKIEQVFEMQGKQYNPEEDGFVFSTKRFEQFKSRQQHLFEVKIAAKVNYDPVEFAKYTNPQQSAAE